MKTIRTTALTAVILLAGFAAQAHAGVIELSADTVDFGTKGDFIGAGTIVTIKDDKGAGSVINGALDLDFDFRYQPYHVGLSSVAGSNNGQFTLSNGGTRLQFGSYDLDAQGGLTTDAFDGIVTGGDWLLRLDNPSGGDPWSAFAVTASYSTGNGDNGGNGGGDGSGGGQVPAPAPLGLIAAMALFGAWRRKCSAAG